MKAAISPEEIAQVEQDTEALLKDVPPQYLLGFEEFYGRQFQVTPATLIPRPETEELVELVLAQVSDEQLRVVDIGTGTGVIAISLKLARPNWQVTAVDLSTEALAVAEENARQLAADVRFLASDVLGAVNEVDVIVSNPPYIAADEWREMDASVRKFEPKMALFAEDNGLAIYRQIAQEAQQKLSVNGQIFLEIGYQQGAAVKALFEAAFPDKKVQLHQDLSGHDRMIQVGNCG
ncbi:protein-(glutamine-N5) methyltransferase, release factor-specific [Enterococcus canis]|uniref:Release factor glutamine methyltransferase n=2 Tax=Enterococcus canis TaxID=214095 RepID=A0A1L8RD60_9ENTE|nr:protein-(glutamine-N5) methyltransferase, release factor-specific [Enterococcus canis]